MSGVGIQPVQSSARRACNSNWSRGVMFKRVLLCYDGTAAGRRALRRGAELAVLLGAKVFVLSFIPMGVADPAVLAGAAGHACIVDEAAEQRKLLDESIEWLKAR